MKGKIPEETEFWPEVQRLLSNHEDDQLKAMKKFQEWVSSPDPPIDIIVDAGIVPRFVNLLNVDKNVAIQTYAALIVGNIGCGTPEQTKTIIDAGAVPILIGLLRSECAKLQNTAVWALGNIAADSVQYRDIVLDCGIMDPLLSMFNHKNLIKSAAWTLKNICGGKPPRPDFERLSQSLPFLYDLLCHDDPEVLSDVCCTIRNLTDGPEDRFQKIIDTGLCERLIPLLLHSSEKISLDALRAIGNIVTGGDDQTQVILNLGVLPRLLHMLKSSTELIRSECCWVISNITAGTRDQIQTVVDANILPSVIDILSTSQDDNTIYNAVWALANICAGGSATQTMFIVNNGCIPPICKLLTFKNSRILMVALDGLMSILHLGLIEANVNGGENRCVSMIEECSGHEKIFSLISTNKNCDVTSRAIQIIDTYKFSTPRPMSVSET